MLWAFSKLVAKYKLKLLAPSNTVAYNLGSRPPWGSFAIFLGVARASDKNIHKYF